MNIYILRNTNEKLTRTMNIKRKSFNKNELLKNTSKVSNIWSCCHVTMATDEIENAAG